MRCKFSLSGGDFSSLFIELFTILDQHARARKCLRSEMN